MTTNGVLLGPFAEELRDAGLSSVNISLDTVNPVVFREITGADRLPEVLTGIDRALEAGLRVRLNCVPQKGVNDTEWDSLLALAKDRPVDVRFIEMMPIGAGRMEETVSNEALLSAIRRRYPAIRRDPAVHGDGPAVYYRIPGWQGSAGFISAIHGKFCDRCNRIRLTAQGKLKPCLCFNDAVDLREILRNTTEERRTDALKAAIREGILRKPAEHRFGESGGVTEEKFMTQIGG
jgi:molybdenum cofactor biosynthesis enzyme MoaA